MFTTLLFVACLDVAVRGTCIEVVAFDSRMEPRLTWTSCVAGGQLPARQFMLADPTYSRPPWHFGGWKCRSGSTKHHRGGAA